MAQSWNVWHVSLEEGKKCMRQSRCLVRSVSGSTHAQPYLQWSQESPGLARPHASTEDFNWNTYLHALIIGYEDLNPLNSKRSEDSAA